MIVANVTTPAQYFHILRRQMLSKVKKPLILMTPKSLLNHPECVSTIDEMGEGSHFHEVFDDVHLGFRKKDDQIERLIFCSGKVYYDLDKYRKSHEIKNAAIIRIEQLYPWHREELKEIAFRYPNAGKWVWCQEEPQNMGPWTFVQRRLQKLTKLKLRYAGRGSAASPSTGTKAIHKHEQKELVTDAFNK